jgi:uncharacterized membrane protein
VSRLYFGVRTNVFTLLSSKEDENMLHFIEAVQISLFPEAAPHQNHHAATGYQSERGPWRREDMMHHSGLQYFPLSTPFLLILVFFFILLIVLIEIGVLGYAYRKLGINRRYVFALLLLSLLGSYVNIPVGQLPAEHVVSGEEVSFYGMRYVIPVVTEWPGTIIAVNVGGALIPVILSLYLLIKHSLYGRGLLGVVAVAIITHLMAHPVRGVGIAEPTFIPPLIAAGVAILLSRPLAAPLAYIAGSLGTLIGADLSNLGKIQGLGAPVASIGGAGTFDGIFLTGILAVLLAGLATKGPPVTEEER